MKLSIEFTSESERRMRRMMRGFDIRSEEELIAWALGLMEGASMYVHDDRTITVVDPDSIEEIDPDKVVDLQFGRAREPAGS